MNTYPNPPGLPLQPPTQRCGLALASLILGIVGLVVCPLGPLFGIPAVICGHVAQSRIRNSGGTLGGAGLAIAGLITGYIAIAMIVFTGLLAAVAVPNFVKARTAAQRNACMMNLRSMDGAKRTWALENRKLETAVPTEADLFGADKYMREKPTCPANGVYLLNAVSEKPACSVHGTAP
jgi:hypothetical protein